MLVYVSHKHLQAREARATWPVLAMRDCMASLLTTVNALHKGCFKRPHSPLDMQYSKEVTCLCWQQEPAWPACQHQGPLQLPSRRAVPNSPTQDWSCRCAAAMPGRPASPTLMADRPTAVQCSALQIPECNAVHLNMRTPDTDAFPMHLRQTKSSAVAVFLKRDHIVQ